MQAAGVEAVVDASSLAVVGLVEVVGHIPRIYGEYRKLLRSARTRKPSVAILTDSPDFHLRLARQLKRLGVPVVYLVAPQVWAWRKERLPLLRRTVDHLLCIFPFEEEFFTQQGIKASYIGHPLTRLIRPSAGGPALRERFDIPEGVPVIVLLPGSRKGEAMRHLPHLVEAAELIGREVRARFILALPEGFSARVDLGNFRERFSRASIQVQEGQTWNVLSCADLALAASGTVTIEACLLNTPMITFYRVNGLSWLMGKLLVRVPFYSMVNLIAERAVVPELLQGRLSGRSLAQEALRLLRDEEARARMKADLKSVAEQLHRAEDPIEIAASHVREFVKEELVHVS